MGQLLTLADISRVKRLVLGPKEFRLAPIAVDALSIVSTILADTTALVVAINVQGHVFLIDLLVVGAVVRVAETVTSYTNKTSVSNTNSENEKIHQASHNYLLRSHVNFLNAVDCRHFFCSNPLQQVAHCGPHVLCWHLQNSFLGVFGSSTSQVSAWPLHMHRPPILISLIE